MSNKLDWDEVARKVCKDINEPCYRLLDLRLIMRLNILKNMLSNMINDKDYTVDYIPTLTNEEYDIVNSRDEIKSLWNEIYK